MPASCVMIRRATGMKSNRRSVAQPVTGLKFPRSRICSNEDGCSVITKIVSSHWSGEFTDRYATDKRAEELFEIPPWWTSRWTLVRITFVGCERDNTTVAKGRGRQLIWCLRNMLRSFINEAIGRAADTPVAT